MNPYAAVIRPADKSPRAVIRLLPAGRVLSKALKGVVPTGVRASHRPTPEGLLMVTTGSREFTKDEQNDATTGLQDAVDRRFGAGSFVVEGYTRDTLPTLEPGSRAAEIIAAAQGH